MNITVATFNLRNNRARDGENAWALRVDVVASMFRRTGAQIVGTQEGYVEMLIELGERLPEFRWIGVGRRGGSEDEFNALFYRGDQVRVQEQGHFWLSETPEVPGSSSWQSSVPRMCTWARFAPIAASGGPLMVYNTHLDHQSAQAREQGIRLICRRIGEFRRQDGLPALLIGDLNASEGSPVLRFLREESGLRDAYSAMAGAVGRTYHGFSGGVEGDPIDHIFATPDVEMTGTMVRRETLDGRYPSDHYPVVTTARLA